MPAGEGAELRSGGLGLFGLRELRLIGVKLLGGLGLIGALGLLGLVGMMEWVGALRLVGPLERVVLNHNFIIARE